MQEDTISLLFSLMQAAWEARDRFLKKVLSKIWSNVDHERRITLALRKVVATFVFTKQERTLSNGNIRRIPIGYLMYTLETGLRARVQCMHSSGGHLAVTR